MPTGKGTYGSKRGRPKKQTTVDRTDEANAMRTVKKGTKSKTRKGDKDFTTKKGNKDFDVGGKRIKKKMGPYQKFVSKHRKKGKTMAEIGAMWRKTKK